MGLRLLGNIPSYFYFKRRSLASRFRRSQGIQQPCNLLSTHPTTENVAMPSAVWSGHLHFGLVVMPVRLLVAARTKATRFRRLHRKPVNHLPSATDFPSSAVAPDSGGEKVYALLLEAMRKEACIGIARIGMHRREHMLILRPSEDCLVAHTMFYANEVRPAPRIESEHVSFSDKELSMATALIKGYAGEFDPTKFKDLYQERIRKIIDAEVSNRIQRFPRPQKQVKAAPDLMEQIRLSLAQIESKKSDAKSPKKPVRKSTTAARKKPQRERA